MAIIEEVRGILRRVDTDKKQLALDIQIIPPEPEMQEEWFTYDLPTYITNDFPNFIGKHVIAVAEDKVITRLEVP